MEPNNELNPTQIWLKTNDYKGIAARATQIVKGSMGQIIFKKSLWDELIKEGLVDSTIYMNTSAQSIIQTTGRLSCVMPNGLPNLKDSSEETCYSLKSVTTALCKAQGIPYGVRKQKREPEVVEQKAKRGRKPKNHQITVNTATTPVPTNAVKLPFTVNKLHAEGDGNTYSKTGKFLVWIVPVGIVLLLVAAGVIFAPQIAKAFGG